MRRRPTTDKTAQPILAFIFILSFILVSLLSNTYSFFFRNQATLLFLYLLVKGEKLPFIILSCVENDRFYKPCPARPAASFLTSLSSLCRRFQSQDSRTSMVSSMQTPGSRRVAPRRRRSPPHQHPVHLLKALWRSQRRSRLRRRSS